MVRWLIAWPTQTLKWDSKTTCYIWHPTAQHAYITSKDPSTSFPTGPLCSLFLFAFSLCVYIHVYLCVCTRVLRCMCMNVCGGQREKTISTLLFGGLFLLVVFGFLFVWIRVSHWNWSSSTRPDGPQRWSHLHPGAGTTGRSFCCLC